MPQWQLAQIQQDGVCFNVASMGDESKQRLPAAQPRKWIVGFPFFFFSSPKLRSLSNAPPSTHPHPPFTLLSLSPSSSTLAGPSKTLLGKLERARSASSILNINVADTAGGMSSEPVFVLPGDHIDPEYIPSHPTKPLRLGPGLRHVPPNDILPTLAGQLVTDRPKNAIRVENSEGRVRNIPWSTIFQRESDELIH